MWRAVQCRVAKDDAKSRMISGLKGICPVGFNEMVTDTTAAMMMCSVIARFCRGLVSVTVEMAHDLGVIGKADFLLRCMRRRTHQNGKQQNTHAEQVAKSRHVGDV